MTAVTLLSCAVSGVIVGLVARRLPVTTMLGIVGAGAGVFLYSGFHGQPGISLSLDGNTWRGWLILIGGALFVISITAVVHARRWWPYSSPGRSELKRRMRTAAVLRDMVHRRDADAGAQEAEAAFDRDRG